MKQAKYRVKILWKETTVGYQKSKRKWKKQRSKVRRAKIKSAHFSLT